MEQFKVHVDMWKFSLKVYFEITLRQELYFPFWIRCGTWVNEAFFCIYAHRLSAAHRYLAELQQLSSASALQIAQCHKWIQLDWTPVRVIFPKFLNEQNTENTSIELHLVFLSPSKYSLYGVSIVLKHTQSASLMGIHRRMANEHSLSWEVS